MASILGLRGGATVCSERGSPKRDNLVTDPASGYSWERLVRKVIVLVVSGFVPASSMKVISRCRCTRVTFGTEGRVGQLFEDFRLESVSWSS